MAAPSLWLGWSAFKRKQSFSQKQTHSQLLLLLCRADCPRQRRRSSLPAASSWQTRPRRRPARPPAAPHEASRLHRCSSPACQRGIRAPCQGGPARPHLNPCTLRSAVCLCPPVPRPSLSIPVPLALSRTTCTCCTLAILGQKAQARNNRRLHRPPAVLSCSPLPLAHPPGITRQPV